MNFIKYGDYNFHGDSARYGKDGLLIEGQVEQRVALFGDELTADSFTFIINSRKCAGEQTGETFNYAFLLDVFNRPLKTNNGKYLIVKNVFPDYRNFTAGTPLDLYNDPLGEVIGRFYVEDVTQVSRKTVKFTCTDCIGMLAKMEDYGGGLWLQTDNATAGDVIAEIMAGSNVQYAVQDEVASARVIGRLPRENRRISLGKLLVAVGASVVEDHGVMRIEYIGGDPETTVPRSDIYLHGGEVRKQSPATKVQVIEHNFFSYADDALVTLFDNTSELIAADNQLVIFQDPCYDLKWNNAAVPVAWEKNVNYCYVTGTGVLTGKAYTHTTRVIERSTGVNAAENIVTIEDNELIGLFNSANVTKRMANYYKLPMSIDYEQIDEIGTLSAGTPVNITDPFGVARTAWIRHKQFPIGNKTKAKMNALVNWEGGPYGSTYSAFKVFQQSDILSGGGLVIPPKMVGKEALVVLIGGAGGGQAGYDGEDGHNVTGTITNTRLGEPAAGGKGGNMGLPGKRSYVYSFQIPSLAAGYQSVVIGDGGAGGVSNGEEGQDGEHTVFAGHSSAEGERARANVVNLLSGSQYCKLGQIGYRGSDGGIGSGYDDVGKDTSTNGVAHLGATGGRYSNGMSWTMGAPYRYFNSAGAGGGGATFMVNGGNGSSGVSGTTTFGAVGGKGATARNKAQATPTRSGDGGDGGGGGGGASAGAWQEQGSSTRHDDRGTGGAGGKGGKGGKGGEGLIIMYYNE